MSKLRDYKKRTKLKNIALTAFTIILVLTIMELVLRYVEDFDSMVIIERVDDLNKNIKTKHVEGYAVDVRLEDNLVLYHPDFKKYFDATKKDGTFRIVMIGDSMTYGHGVQRDKTFGYLLEKMLNQKKKTGQEYEILNFAFPGYNLVQINRLFHEQVLQFNPDLVVYGYFVNDFNTIKSIGIDNDVTRIVYGYYVFPYLFELPLNNWLLKHSTMYRFMNMKIVNILKKINPKYEPKEYYISEEESIATLNHMIKTSNKGNIPFYVINIPDMKRLEKDYAEGLTYESYDCQPLGQILQQHNIKCMDLGLYLKGHDPKEIFLTEQETNKEIAGHFNEKGHEIIADMLYKYLKEQKIV